MGPHGFDLFEISNVNIGLLVILGVTSIGVYGIALAGWSSNNKYSLLGCAALFGAAHQLRTGAGAVAGGRGASRRLAQSARHRRAAGHARHRDLEHLRRLQFVAFFIYLMAAYAETNRSPFDLPEAESELTGGYHTEYSSMKFAMFFMAEYANMINVGCVATLLFLGGWTSPFGDLMPPFAEHLDQCGVSDLLVCDQGFRFPVPLRLGAGNFAALPLRPADELWLAVLDAAGHPEHCGNKPLACVSLRIASTPRTPMQAHQQCAAQTRFAMLRSRSECIGRGARLGSKEILNSHGRKIQAREHRKIYPKTDGDRLRHLLSHFLHHGIVRVDAWSAHPRLRN